MVNKDINIDMHVKLLKSHYFCKKSIIYQNNQNFMNIKNIKIHVYINIKKVQHVKMIRIL